MCKKLFVSALVLLFSLSGIAYAKNMSIWRDPSLNFSVLKKILVLPANATLNAGTQMRPTGRVQQDLEAWTINALRSASKGKILVHTLNDAKREHDLIYDEPTSDVNVILSRLIEMGYQAQVNVNILQEFSEEYVPPQTFHYTTYENTYVSMNTPNGYTYGTIQTPKDNAITIPDRNDIYLHTKCSVVLFMLEDCLNASLRNSAYTDYKAIATCDVYKYYRNGPVLEVVNNAIKASMKSLVTGKK